MLFWVLALAQPILLVFTRGRPTYGQAGALEQFALAEPVVGYGSILGVTLLSVHYSIRGEFRTSAIAKWVVLYAAVLALTAMAHNAPGAILSIGVATIAVVGAAARAEYADVVGELRKLSRVLVISGLTLGVLIPDIGLVYDTSQRRLLGVDSRLAGVAAAPAYMATLALIGYVLEVSGRTRNWKTHATLALVTIAWAQGRLQLAGLVLVTLYYLMSRLAGSQLRRLRAALVSGTFLLAFAPAVGTVAGWLRTAPEVEEFTSVRTVVWDVAVRAWGSDPVIGAGPAIFGGEELLVGDEWAAGAFLNGHNQLLHAGALGGWLAAAATVGILLALLRTAIRADHLSPGGGMCLVGLLYASTSVPFHLSGLTWGLIPALAVAALAQSGGSVVRGDNSESGAEGTIAPGEGDLEIAEAAKKRAQARDVQRRSAG